VTDKKPLTPVEEAAWQRLDNRSKRLARLVELRAPPGVIAAEARMVFEATLMLDPEGASRSFFVNMEIYQRNSAGFCSICENPLSPTEMGKKLGVCDAHLNETEEDDDVTRH
jgi:hypothetical protein